MTYCGVLNLDKPSGPTSRAIVDRIVQLVRREKVGHAGTLDPLATGVLIVCVGHATRLINLIQEGRKRYRGRFQLGLRSDTDDITGNVSEGGNWRDVTEQQLAALLPELIGQIEQVPPQFSAVHVEGRRAYDLARLGQPVELDARSVDVFSIRLTEFRSPEFELEIECGSGTYIRSIGRDIGTSLGCGAVMTQLRRLSVGPFDSANSIAPDLVTPETLKQHLHPPCSVVSHFPQRRLTDDEVIAIRRGQTVPVNEGANSPRPETHQSSSSPVDPRIALIRPDGHLLGIGEINHSTGRLQPRIVFPTD